MMTRLFFLLKTIFVEISNFLYQFAVHVIMVILFITLWYLFILSPLAQKIDKNKVIQTQLMKKESDVERFRRASPESLFKSTDLISVFDLEDKIYAWIEKNQTIRLIELKNLDGPLSHLEDAGFFDKSLLSKPDTLQPGSVSVTSSQILSFSINNSMQWTRHEISLILEGNYFQIMEFLRQFQSNQIFWTTMKFNVIDYSLARATISLYVYTQN